MTASEPLENLKEMIREAIEKIFPSSDVALEEIKDEVWTDLSRIYYKYEDEAQKRAFREVMKEIAEKMREDKWETVYKKIYREEQKEKNNTFG
jgi:Sec7-like guanine-nucleotide exchange factor